MAQKIGCWGFAGIVLVGAMIAGAIRGPDTNTPTATASPRSVAAPSGDLRAQARGVARAMLDAARPCDEATGRLADINSDSAMRREASRAQTACRTASANLREIDVPAAATGQLREDIEQGLARCVAAFDQRSRALSLGVRVLNGENVNQWQVEQELDEAKDTSVRCVAALMPPLMEAGLTEDDVQRLTGA